MLKNLKNLRRLKDKFVVSKVYIHKKTIKNLSINSYNKEWYTTFNEKQNLAFIGHIIKKENNEATLKY